jgi:hypothetical protein
MDTIALPGSFTDLSAIDLADYAFIAINVVTTLPVLIPATQVITDG